MNERQKSMLSFDQSSDNLIFGDLSSTGFSINELESVNMNSNIVEQVINSGLTGVVYKLKKKEVYNLKRKRETSRVRNIDGQLSFLNELICRKRIMEYQSDFDSLKNSIVKCYYANYRKGILLSDWIEGVHPPDLQIDWINQVLEIALDLQKIGLFEWDLSHGNILLENGKVKLFDFGYCYSFDPLNEFNPEGINEPRFHALERLETRYLMLALYKYQGIHGTKKTLEFYSQVKKAGIKMYQNHLRFLEANGASKKVMDYFDTIIKNWSNGISNNESLFRLYLSDVFRSHLLDIHDDLSGKSCTPDTLLRIKHLKELNLASVWGEIKENVDETSKEELQLKLLRLDEEAIKHQL